MIRLLRRALFAGLLGSASMGCGSGLPPVAEPLTPTPDAEFRKSQPARSGRWGLHLPPVQVGELKCGLRVATVQRPGSGTVAIALVNQYGGEPWFTMRPGLSTLMNNTLLEGSRPPNGKTGRHLGILEDKVDVGVSESSSTLYLHTLPDGLSGGLSALAWTTIYPAFTQVAVTRETAESRFDHAFSYAPGMQSAIHTLYAQLVGPKHRLAGPPPKPKTYSPDEVKLEYLRRYAPEDALLIVVGDFSTHEQVLRLAETRFASWKNPHRIKSRKELRRKKFTKELADAWKRNLSRQFQGRDDKDDAFSFILLPGLHPEHSDYPAYQLLMAELRSIRAGGVAYELREQRQQSYAMYVTAHAHPAGAETLIVAPVKPEGAVSATKHIIAAINKLRNEGLSEAKIREHRNAHLAAYSAQLQTDWGVATAVANDYATHGPGSLHLALGREMSALRTITPEDTRRVAREVLRTEAAAILIQGPRSAAEGIETLR